MLFRLYFSTFIYYHSGVRFWYLKSGKFCLANYPICLSNGTNEGTYQRRVWEVEKNVRFSTCQPQKKWIGRNLGCTRNPLGYNKRLKNASEKNAFEKYRIKLHVSLQRRYVIIRARELRSIPLVSLKRRLLRRGMNPCPQFYRPINQLEVMNLLS